MDAIRGIVRPTPGASYTLVLHEARSRDKD